MKTEVYRIAQMVTIKRAALPASSRIKFGRYLAERELQECLCPIFRVAKWLPKETTRSQ